MTRGLGLAITKHVKILAWIHLLGGGILFTLGLALSIEALLDRDTTHTTRAFILGFFFWLGVCGFLPSFLAGLGLLRQKRWARILMIIISCEYLIGFPIGTALGGYGLWALLNQQSKAAFASLPRASVRAV